PNQTISITDLTGGQGISTGAPNINGSTATWTVSGVIPSGDRVQLVIPGVTNPATGSYTITISTSSDNGAATPAYQIAAGAPVPSFGPSILVSSLAASAPGITYEVTFFNTGTLTQANGDTISLT